MGKPCGFTNVSDDLQGICCPKYGARKLLDSTGMGLKYLRCVKRIGVESGS